MVNPPPQAPDENTTLEKAVGSTRFTVSLAIMGVGLSSSVLLIYSLITLVKAIYSAFITEAHFDIEGVKHLALELIEMADFFLLGMVLYVVAIGMYQLFIQPNVRVLSWMQVRNLDDLKSQILNVVVVMLVVTFLGDALSADGTRDFLFYGLTIAAVVIAVSIFTWVHQQAHDDHA